MGEIPSGFIWLACCSKASIIFRPSLFWPWSSTAFAAGIAAKKAKTTAMSHPPFIPEQKQFNTLPIISLFLLKLSAVLLNRIWIPRNATKETPLK
ncbi:hypothetical protein [Candidatus Nitrotoga fabula]|uniref:hypothetical protein n=1 Tax=Candidatus Nitrotoga fabula TaxID=2182327 RepID=UPI001BB484D2|nr:hypothetical protein [Candidatus Nitrotoga fabula]